MKALPCRLVLPHVVIGLLAGWILCGVSWAAMDNANTQAQLTLGELTSGGIVNAFQAPDGTWGVRVAGAGMASATQLAPVQFEFLDAKSNVTRFATGYDAVERAGNGTRGNGEVVSAIGRAICRGRPLERFVERAPVGSPRDRDRIGARRISLRHHVRPRSRIVVAGQ